MLTHLYIEALLTDPEAADQVWEAWDDVKIDDETACMLITGVCSFDVLFLRYLRLRGRYRLYVTNCVAFVK